MSLTGIVKRDAVKLPEGVHLPDGTRVRIVTLDSVQPTPPANGSLRRLSENPVDDPVTDGARRHDDYLGQ